MARPDRPKMLHLLQTPHWSAGTVRHDLPAIVPAWMVAYLAVQADWVSRDHLLALLWPSAATAEAQHSLRTNLLRARQLLTDWGVGSLLEAERRRVRLQLPTDVAALRHALADVDLQRALALYQRPLLDDVHFSGFPALVEWAELERAELHRRWRETLLRGMARPDQAPALVLEAAQRLLAHDGLDDEAMARFMSALLAAGRGSDAARAYDAFRARLDTELGVAPSPALQALAGRLPARARAVGEGGPAVPRDAFVGRALELQQLQSMFGQSGTRLVTLLGPGGIGKSRLARAVGAGLGPSFRDGASWIAMSDLPDSSGVWPRLAAALGLVALADAASRGPVLRALATTERLIILDNAEHLDGFVDILPIIVAAAPSVRWLVTSRTPMGLPGERVFALEELACPPEGSTNMTMADARAFDAVRLLESRLLWLDPGFDLAAQMAPCLSLLQRLGGWPLAIELAAHAIATQSVATVLADLAVSLDTLAVEAAPVGARHASLNASLQLSWRRLSPEQQTALARLSMFCGGFTRRAAFEVTHCDAAVFAALVDRLLVKVSGGGRFDLHPLVAQFAGEQLALQPAARHAAGELHAQHFLDRLIRYSDRRHSDWEAAATDIECDFENFRAAWRWALERPRVDPLAGAARAWSMFSNAKGRVNETTPLVEQALARSSDDACVRAPMLLALANLRYRAGDLDTAVGLAREAVAAARAAGDAIEVRAALNSLALPLNQQGRLDEAQHSVDEALAMAVHDHAEQEVAQLSNTSAMIAKARGDFGKAGTLYMSAIALHRRHGNQRGLALCLNNLGNVYRVQNDLPAAQRHLEEALRICELHGIHGSRSFALGNLGLVAYQDGRMEAARLYAGRVLAESAAEPVMRLAAHSLLALTAIADGDLHAAADAVREFGRGARSLGSRDAMLSSLVVHAKLRLAQGWRSDAAAQLTFVREHPGVSAVERADAQRTLDALDLSAAEAAEAQQRAGGLDFDVLLEAVATAQGT